MKRMVFVLSILTTFVSQAAHGQNFTYTAPDTMLPGAPDSTTQFISFINNQESQATTFWVEMDTTNKPPDWLVSFCTSGCWPPWVTVDSNYAIGPGSMDTVLVDFHPDSLATSTEGSVTMTVTPAGHPELAKGITFHVFFLGGVNDEVRLPADFAILRAYPNPFNGVVNLSFALSAPARAELSIIDLSGRKIADLFGGVIGAGERRFIWRPGQNASGIYLARLDVDGQTLMRKVVYLR